MANAISCDNCGATVVFNGTNGDSLTGEESAWIKLRVAGNQAVDACTRSCATDLLADDGPLRPMIDAHLEVISEIARAISERDAEDDDEGERNE